MKQRGTFYEYAKMTIDSIPKKVVPNRECMSLEELAICIKKEEDRNDVKRKTFEELERKLILELRRNASNRVCTIDGFLHGMGFYHGTEKNLKSNGLESNVKLWHNARYMIKKEIGTFEWHGGGGHEKVVRTNLGWNFRKIDGNIFFWYSEPIKKKKWWQL